MGNYQSEYNKKLTALNQAINQAHNDPTKVCRKYQDEVKLNGHNYTIALMPSINSDKSLMPSINSECVITHYVCSQCSQMLKIHFVRPPIQNMTVSMLPSAPPLS